MSDIMRLLNREPWVNRRRCREMSPDIFFPDSKSREAEMPAKKVCVDCPVRAECLDMGMSEDYGIWGGLNEKEREALSRGVQPSPKRQPPSHGTEARYRRHRRDGEEACDACKAAAAQAHALRYERANAS